MEYSMNVLLEERAEIENELDHLKTLIDNHYKQIHRLKKEQIGFEIKRREVSQTIDLIKYHNKHNVIDIL